MKWNRILWAVVVLLVVFQCAWAKEPVRAAKGKKGILVPPPGPNLDYVISEMTATGRAEGKVAKFDMKLKIEVLSDRKQQVRLLTGDISISKLSVSGGFFTKGVYLVRSGKSVDLLIERKGKYDIDLSFVQRIKEVKSERSITLPLAPAVKSVVELSLPLPDVEVTTEPEVSFETKHVGDKECLVTVYGGTSELVLLKWIPKAPERELEPIVFADQLAVMEVGRGVLRVDSTVAYSVLQGKVNKFAVKLPKDCSLLSLDGKEIRSWDIEEKGGEKILKIDLIGEVKDEHQIELKIEKVLPKIPVVFDVPKIEVMDVAREKGFIAVTAAKGIQIEATDVKDISQIDVRDLPKSLTQKASDALLAFKYLKRPFEIKLSAEEVEAKVSAEVFTRVKASLDSLRMSSAIQYQIRDAGVFHLKIKLADDLKLIDVKGENINNWELDPKTKVLNIDLRSKAEGGYALDIETEMELKQTQGVAIPTIELLDVERERGFLTVSAVPGIRVETVGIKGASQIDVKELPPELLRAVRGAADLAFRYIKPGYQITTNISEIQPEVEAEIRNLVTIDEKEMNLTADILYKIRKAGVFQLKVKIPKDLRRQDVVGDDIDEQSWDEASETLTVSLKKKVEGEYQLKIEAQKTLEDITKGLDIPVLSALDVKKERGFLAIKTKTSIRLKPAEGKMKGLDDIDITELPWDVQIGGGTVALAYKYFAPPWSLSLSVEEIPSRVTAETFNFVSLGEKLAQVSATVKYSILHAGVETFKVKMPESAENVDINGDAIRHKDEDKEKKTWTVTLQSKKTGEYRLFFTFQIKIPKGQTTFEYAGLQALGVERETGYIAIAARSDVEIEPNMDATKKLTPIDEREIPAEYKVGITIPILAAYRYLEHPYTAAMSAKVHEPAEVTVAIIETCKLETTVTKIGETITDFVCNIRNSREQYLELELPQDARIDHAFVGGDPVTPLQERRPKAGAKPIVAEKPAAAAEKAEARGAAAPAAPPASIPKYRDEDTVIVTMIPIARAGKSDEAFEVRLRYRSKRGKLGAFGTLDLTCPRINIGIMRLGWEIGLPKGYSIISDSGNMDQVENTYDFEPQLRSLDADVTVSKMRRVSVSARPRSRGGLSKNMQAMSNLNVEAQLEQRVAGQGGKQGASRRSIYTGQRPDLPNKFYFQSLIVSPEEPGHICATYIKGNVTLPFYGVVGVLVLVGCFFAWRAMPFPPLGRFGIFLAAAVVVLMLRTLAAGAFEGLLNVVISSILIFDAGALLMIIGGAFQKWQASRPPRPPSGPARFSSRGPSSNGDRPSGVSREDLMPRGQKESGPPKPAPPEELKADDPRSAIMPRKTQESRDEPESADKEKGLDEEEADEKKDKE
ncbi:MAG: hypothetical protein GXP25_21410 [Planctomycetes bacterium]|nr:hypothetical protein [Planctomycetota bacterium]